MTEIHYGKKRYIKAGKALLEKPFKMNDTVIDVFFNSSNCECEIDLNHQYRNKCNISILSYYHEQSNRVFYLCE